MEKHVFEQYNDAILKDAACRFDFRTETVTMLDGFENFIFEVERDQQPYILRLSHSSKKTLDAVESEIDFLRHLANEGVLAARPAAARSGAWVESIPAQGDDFFHAVLFEKAPGRHPEREAYTPAFFTRWGQAMGSLHRAGKKYHPTQPAWVRPHWYEEVEVTQPERYLPAGHEAVLREIQRITEQIQALPVAPDSYGIIHNDAHPYNILVDGDKLTLIDFEDSIQMWYDSEIAICLFFMTAVPPDGKTREELARAFLPPFLKGYQQQNPLPVHWEDRLDLFLKFREAGQYVALCRAADLEHLAPWPRAFLQLSRPRMEQGLPYLNLKEVLE